MSSIDRQIAFGMSTIRYRTTPGKASLLENMIVTDDGTLRSITGPTLYEPRHVFSKAPVALGTVHAIFHGYFNAGDKEILVIHAGTSLWSHEGAKKGWVELSIPRSLRDDSEKSAYSTFDKFGETLIFSDGVGPPIVIDASLRCMNLGFAMIPNAPSAKGPETATHSKYNSEGTQGYSWPGGLGTPGGKLAGEIPNILKGSWSWCIRYQDFYGNYSALSQASAEVEYGPKKAQPVDNFRMKFIAMSAVAETTSVGRPATPGIRNILRTGLKVKGLKRAAAIDIPKSVPNNCRRIQIGRTLDTERNENDFYLVASMGSEGGTFHDSRLDSSLTTVMKENWPVPVMTSFFVDNGRLIVASGPYIYLSDPGFAGTFNKENRLMLTADGKQSTAIFALNGKRYAATKTSITDVTDLTSPIVISTLIGISGPKAWTYLPGESGIVFVSEPGVFSLSSQGLTKISDPDVNRFWLNEVNKVRLDSTVVWYSRKRQEVRIALTPTSDVTNKLILAYSALGWRTYRLGVAVSCFAYIEDMEAVGGNDGQSRNGQYTSDDVYILERESALYAPPARQSIYESDYIPLDEALGFVRGKVLTMFFGFIESYSGSAATVEYEINYDTDIAETHSMRLDDAVGVNIMEGGERRPSWGTFLIGTDNFHEKRKVYRKARIDLSNANRFKFTIKADYPFMLELVDYLFEFNVETIPGTRELDVTEV